MTANCDDALGLHLLSCVGGTKHTFSNKLKMPWERKFIGPYDRLAEVHKLPTPLKDLIPVMRSDTKCQDVGEQLEVTGAFKRAGLKLLKACDERLWTDRLSAERKAAIRKWTTLVSSEPLAWEVAVQHFSQGSMVFATGGLGDSIRDTLAAKASNTLHARANPLFRFAKFCADHGLQAWPAVYDFLNSSSDVS